MPDRQPSEPAFLRTVDTVRSRLRRAAALGGMFRVFCRALVALALLAIVDFAACRLLPVLDASFAWRLVIFGLWSFVLLHAVRYGLLRPLWELPRRKDVALRLATEGHLDRMRGLAEDAANTRKSMAEVMENFARQEDFLEAALEFATVSAEDPGRAKDSVPLRREVLREADRMIPEDAAERFLGRNLILGFREYLVALAGVLFCVCIPFALAPEWTVTALARVLLPGRAVSWNTLWDASDLPGFDTDPMEAGPDPALETPPRLLPSEESRDPDFERLSPEEAAREMDRYLAIVREELDRIVKLQQRNREEIRRLHDRIPSPARVPDAEKTSALEKTPDTDEMSDDGKSLSHQTLPLLADQREIRRLLIDPSGGLPRYLDQLTRIVDLLPEEKAARKLLHALRAAVDELDAGPLASLDPLFGALIRSVPETAGSDAGLRGLAETTARILHTQQGIEETLRTWEERVRHLLDDVRLERRWTALLDVQYDVYSRSRGKLLATLGLARTELSTEALGDLRELAARQTEALEAYRELLKQLAARDSLDRRWEPRLQRFSGGDLAKTMQIAADAIRLNHLGAATARQAEILETLGESPERLSRWQDLAAATGRREGESGAVDPDADDTGTSPDGTKLGGDTGDDEQLAGGAPKQLTAAQGDAGEQVESDREGRGAGDGRILDGNAWVATGGGGLNPLQKSDLRKSWGELLHRESLNGGVPREEILPEYREETLRYFQRLRQP